jgi:hypothetical protein
MKKKSWFCLLLPFLLGMLLVAWVAVSYLQMLGIL